MGTIRALCPSGFKAQLGGCRGPIAEGGIRLRGITRPPSGTQGGCAGESPARHRRGGQYADGTAVAFQFTWRSRGAGTAKGNGTPQGRPPDHETTGPQDCGTKSKGSAVDRPGHLRRPLHRSGPCVDPVLLFRVGLELLPRNASQVAANRARRVQNVTQVSVVLRHRLAWCARGSSACGKGCGYVPRRAG